MTSIILRIYNDMIGKSIGYESGNLFFQNCVDNNLDGIERIKTN